ncbi:hypothetical protein NC651_035504 [Populus alba x Populus x berolinensis]|nr:hypothetical protein NC651_035504 [Populus alba x Populus x berolinensis]
MHISEEGDALAVKAPRRQYLTSSRVAATSDAVPQEKQKLKGPTLVLISMSSSDDTVHLSTF